ncbi:MAG: hypothetical protein FWC43_08485 [Planctomycetaceae bacterium]|nr:hypothetical protein [Planctomycetaceae bacterium]
MFFIDPTFLKIVIIVAGISFAIFGLTFLTLRRRAEILDYYFTPDDEGLEEDFFRRRTQRQNTTQTQEEPKSQESSQRSEEWGARSGE